MRVALLCLLVACGDNTLRPEYDSTFDGTDQLLVFGDLRLFPGTLQPEPLPGIEVCLAGVCEATADDGSFVVRAPIGSQEAVVEFHDLEVPVVVPVVAGTQHERNLAGTITLARQTVDTIATGFGTDAALDRAGVVLVVAQHDSTDPVSFAIDGLSTGYFDAMNMPDPASTEISARGSAAWFGVAPGEVTIRITAGVCSIEEDGWPGAADNEIRAPVVAGSITMVRPLCR